MLLHICFRMFSLTKTALLMVCRGGRGEEEGEERERESRRERRRERGKEGEEEEEQEGLKIHLFCIIIIHIPLVFLQLLGMML